MAESKDGEFTLPEIYSFPPFFTLQPVDSTRERQLRGWKDLIVDWHATNKQNTLVVADWPLWENATLGRRLSTEGIAAVLEFVVSTGYGEWTDTGKTRLTVFFKTPDEWASMIYAWVTANAMTGNVYTLYELHSGEISAGEEFYGTDSALLLKALQVLQRQGKAEIIPSDDALDETGVKFLAV